MRKEDACGGREKERRQDGSRGTSYGITARLCAGYKERLGLANDPATTTIDRSLAPRHGHHLLRCDI